MHLTQTFKGTGDPLLLLQAFIGICQDWQDVMDEIEAGLHRIMPNLRGPGRSPDYDQFSFQSATNQIQAGLNQMDIGSLPTMGMSGALPI